MCLHNSRGNTPQKLKCKYNCRWWVYQNILWAECRHLSYDVSCKSVFWSCVMFIRILLGLKFWFAHLFIHSLEKDVSNYKKEDLQKAKKSKTLSTTYFDEKLDMYRRLNWRDKKTKEKYLSVNTNWEFISNFSYQTQDLKIKIWLFDCRVYASWAVGMLFGHILYIIVYKTMTVIWPRRHLLNVWFCASISTNRI